MGCRAECKTLERVFKECQSVQRSAYQSKPISDFSEDWEKEWRSKLSVNTNEIFNIISLTKCKPHEATKIYTEVPYSDILMWAIHDTIRIVYEIKEAQNAG